MEADPVSGDQVNCVMCVCLAMHGVHVLLLRWGAAPWVEYPTAQETLHNGSAIKQVL